MSEPLSYVLTLQAQADVEAVVDYLVTESVPIPTITKIHDRVYHAFELIAAQPGIGRRRPEWTSADVRFWTMRTDPYLIIYRERTPLEIIRVWSARRDPHAIEPE